MEFPREETGVSWSGNCAFPQNFLTRKLGKITVMVEV